jgi:hypothetical protein
LTFWIYFKSKIFKHLSVECLFFQMMLTCKLANESMSDSWLHVGHEFGHHVEVILWINNSDSTTITQCSLQEFRSEGAIPPLVSNSGGSVNLRGANNNFNIQFVLHILLFARRQQSL